MLMIHAERHIEDLPLFFARIYLASELLPEAFRLAVRLKHSVYDSIYVALAQREGAALVTADVELARAVQRSGIGVQVELLA